MSSARDNIIQRIRRANLSRADIVTQDVLQQRMQKHLRGPQPQWSESVIDRFVVKAEQSAASIAFAKSEQDIVEQVTAYLSLQSLDGKLLCSATDLPGRLKWPEFITVENRSATTNDRVVLVEAFAAIAETGSVVMCSGEQTPVSLNFLPDYFLCIVRQDRIVSTIEDVWEKIRQERMSMPRAVNIITGPSRTADVEQIIQMGAHGPRVVHLLILE